jgi:hypothetical protein
MCLASSTAFSQTIAKTKPSGRACLAIANVANGDEEVLRPASTAGRNQKLVAHLDATSACEVLVAPFVKYGGLVTGWMPQYLNLDPGREALAPKAPALWNWEKDTGPLEIFVLFFAPGSKKGGEIRELVNAMRKANGANVVKLQGSKLRELIASADFDKEAARHPAQSDNRGGWTDANGGGLRLARFGPGRELFRRETGGGNLPVRRHPLTQRAQLLEKMSGQDDDPRSEEGRACIANHQAGQRN